MLIAGVIIGGIGGVLTALGKSGNSAAMTITGAIMSIVGAIILFANAIILLS